MKQTITFKYVNQPVMNAAHNMRLKMTKKYSIVDKADLLLKKDMEHKEINKRKRKPEIWDYTI